MTNTLKILGFHGYGGNGRKMKEEIFKLFPHHSLDIYCPNGSYKLDNHEEKYTWYNNEIYDNLLTLSENIMKPHKYHDIILDEVEGIYDVVIGFSQGGIIASLLLS